MEKLEYITFNFITKVGGSIILLCACVQQIKTNVYM